MASVLPENFNLVAGVVGTSMLVHHLYMTLGVGQARKKYAVRVRYKIKYPDLYASAENCKNEEHRKAFNCVQRAHQNCLENQPAFLASLIVAGTQYPITSSALGLVYLVGKILYFQGYSTGDPEKRLLGAPAYVGTFGLLGICLKMGFQAVTALMQRS